MYHFSHVGIVVQDMDKAVDFYTRVLGCQVQKKEGNGPVQFTLLKAGSQVIELLKFDEDSKERKEGVISHIAFDVEDINQEITRLKELGLDLLSDQARVLENGMKIFFFTGPDGESIEFVQSAE